MAKHNYKIRPCFFGCRTNDLLQDVVVHSHASLHPNGQGFLFYGSWIGGFKITKAYSCNRTGAPFFMSFLQRSLLDIKQKLVINSLRPVSPAISITRKPATNAQSITPEEVETILI